MNRTLEMITTEEADRRMRKDRKRRLILGSLHLAIAAVTGTAAVYDVYFSPGAGPVHSAAILVNAGVAGFNFLVAGAYYARNCLQERLYRANPAGYAMENYRTVLKG